MRPSSAASSRPSHAGVSGGMSPSARLVEKRKEYDAVMALEKLSAEMVERLEALGDDCEIMAEAGKVHGSVLQHWSRMFGIISLVVSSRNNEAENTESMSKQPEPATATADRLVRLEIAALEQVNQSTK